MKKIFIVAFSVLLVLSVAWSDEDMSGSVSMKYTGVGHDDSKVKAFEYRDDDSEAGITLDFASRIGKRGMVFFNVDRSTSDDQSFSMSLWTDEHLRITASYNEFVHNLIHDHLTNLEAVAAPKVTRSTDFNPDTDFGIVHSEAKARIDYKVNDNVTFFACYRHQQRKGWKQARTMSKCATCHVVGVDRRIDESTKDFQIGAAINVNNFSLVASHLDRRFTEDGPTPTFEYEEAEHPANRTPVFEDRIQYDSVDGPLPFDQVPDVKKRQDTLKIGYKWEKGNFEVSYSDAEVRNTYWDNSFDYNGGYAAFKQRLGEKTTLKLRFRTYEIDNEDYFYDTIERVAVAGPYVGMTYREYMETEGKIFDPDYYRRSAMNRRVNDGIAELRFRYAKRGRLKFGLRYKSVDRDDFEVSEYETETVTNKVYIDWRHWKPKAWKFNANLSYSDISDPFANVDGGCNPDMNTTPVSSALAPGAVQYWEFHDAREYNLSNQPSETLNFRFSAPRSLTDKAHLMFNARYKDDKNDDLDFSTWDRDFLMAGLFYNWMPNEKASFFAGYNYSTDESTTHICIPVMDG